MQSLSKAFIDLADQRFGKLVVLNRVKNAHGGHAYFSCRCDCGKVKIVRSNSLRGGKIVSCGCNRGKHSTHGMTHTRIYMTWSQMLYRCNNENSTSYRHYGGRGIKVCEAWHKFENFYAWATKNGYSENLEIERKNNNKGYSPNNCKWATRKEQMNNTRSNRMLEFQGKCHNIKQWGSITGISPNTIWYRLDFGWSIEDTLTTPTQKRKGAYFGKTKT